MDPTRDDAPAVIKDETMTTVRQDHQEPDAMAHLLMAYRDMLDKPECWPMLEPLMDIVHGIEEIMTTPSADEPQVDIEMPEVMIPGQVEEGGGSGGYGRRRRRRMSKIVVQEDGQFCVRGEGTNRLFGCYATREAADARLAQIERFADSRLSEAATEKLATWHARLQDINPPTSATQVVGDLISEEMEWRSRDMLPFVKQDEHRYTLGPVYVPDIEDAHGEFTDQATLQKALWSWVQKDNRAIYLQHSERVAGQMVEMLTWPFQIEADLTVPGEGVTKYAFPANTPFMGVIWEPWAWDLVKQGQLRGYSIGGSARRMEADIPDAVLV